LLATNMRASLSNKYGLILLACDRYSHAGISRMTAVASFRTAIALVVHSVKRTPRGCGS
jgi:hypothetical protein